MVSHEITPLTTSRTQFPNRTFSVLAIVCTSSPNHVITSVSLLKKTSMLFMLVGGQWSQKRKFPDVHVTRQADVAWTQSVHLCQNPYLGPLDLETVLSVLCWRPCRSCWLRIVETGLYVWRPLLAQPSCTACIQFSFRSGVISFAEKSYGGDTQSVWINEAQFTHDA